MASKKPHTPDGGDTGELAAAFESLRQHDAARVDAVMRRVLTLQPSQARLARPSWRWLRPLLASAAGIVLVAGAGLAAVAYRNAQPDSVPGPVDVAAGHSIDVPMSPPVLSSVNEAILSAAPGSVVELPGGTFDETIRIAKAVTLRAQSGTTVQIGLRAGIQ